MVNCSLNHVALDVNDLEAAVDFYTGLFEMKRVPAPDFGRPYAWLEFDDQQLHLIERGDCWPENQHFALIVDEFETVWDRAAERGAIGEDAGYVRALPNGVVQCYVRDPSGNRVEFMWPDVGTLPEHIEQQVEYVDADAPTDEPAGATIAPSVTRYAE